MGQAHAIKCRTGTTSLFGISDACVSQRHFHVLKGGAAGQERGRLEDESYFPIPDRRANIFSEFGNLPSVQDIAAAVRAIQQAEDTHQSRFARTRSADTPRNSPRAMRSETFDSAWIVVPPT